MSLYDENDGYARIKPTNNISGASNMNYAMRVENLDTSESSLAYGGMIPKIENGKIVQYFADLKIDFCPGSSFTFRQDTKSGDVIDAYFIFQGGKIIVNEEWHHLPPNKSEFYYQQFAIAKPHLRICIGIGSSISERETLKRFDQESNRI